MDKEDEKMGERQPKRHKSRIPEMSRKLNKMTPKKAENVTSKEENLEVKSQNTGTITPKGVSTCTDRSRSNKVATIIKHSSTTNNIITGQYIKNNTSIYKYNLTPSINIDPPADSTVSRRKSMSGLDGKEDNKERDFKRSLSYSNMKDVDYYPGFQEKLEFWNNMKYDVSTPN